LTSGPNRPDIADIDRVPILYAGTDLAGTGLTRTAPIPLHAVAPRAPNGRTSMNQMTRTQAERLSSALELSLPPIALAFPDSVPEGVPEYDGTWSRPV